MVRHAFCYRGRQIICSRIRSLGCFIASPHSNLPRAFQFVHDQPFSSNIARSWRWHWLGSCVRNWWTNACNLLLGFFSLWAFISRQICDWAGRAFCDSFTLESLGQANWTPFRVSEELVVLMPLLLLFRI